MSQGKKNPTFKLTDLAYYFDGVERDRLDAVGASGKAGELLAVRDQLLKLPDEEFEAAIKTVRALVDGRGSPGREPAAGGAATGSGRALFDQVRKGGGSGGSGATGKVSPT